MKDLKKYIEDKLAEYLQHTSYYLVELNILPNKKIEIFIDGDQNIRLEQCIKINQYLIELIDLNSELERDFQIVTEIYAPPHSCRHVWDTS